MDICKRIFANLENLCHDGQQFYTGSLNISDAISPARQRAINLFRPCLAAGVVAVSCLRERTAGPLQENLAPAWFHCQVLPRPVVPEVLFLD